MLLLKRGNRILRESNERGGINLEQEVILEIKNLNKSFRPVKVRKDINIKFNKGECHALIGENGAGKSTLMKILAGAYSKDSGDIILDGEKIDATSPLAAREKGISIIYQELSLISTLSAAENIYLGRIPKKKNGLVDWNKIQQNAKVFFEEVDLNIDPNVETRTLSVAQQQLIEISRALSLNPKVVIMDEPTSSLTDNEIECLFKIIRKLKSQGITVIYISHKLEEILAICDSVTVLKDGAITGQKDIKDTTKSELVNMMVGRSLDQYYPNRTSKPANEVLFEVKDLNVGDYIKNVSFQVKRGEILGFSGLVGAGRTETMRGIFGADKLDSGHMYMEGKEIKNNTPLDAIKNKIAFVTEDRRNEGLVMKMTVRENTTLASFWTFANKFGLIKSKKEHEIANNYIEKLKTKTSGSEQCVVELSGGNQQKIVISKWLNTSAKLYIFDEPTRGIDVGAKAEIYQLIVQLAEEGNAIIVVSSELPEVIGISDRIIVMHEGQIKGSIDKSKATEENIMTLAVGGV